MQAMQVQSQFAGSAGEHLPEARVRVVGGSKELYAHADLRALQRGAPDSPGRAVRTQAGITKSIAAQHGVAGTVDGVCADGRTTFSLTLLVAH